MKKIRILAVLVIIVFIGDMVSDGTSAFMDGWNEAGDSTEYRFSDVDISVKPDKTLAVDSLFNTTIQQKVPYRITSLETKIDSTFWRVTFKVLIFPFALFGLYGFYCMMRVVISVSRGKVFTRENANPYAYFCLCIDSCRLLYGSRALYSVSGCDFSSSIEWLCDGSIYTAFFMVFLYDTGFIYRDICRRCENEGRTRFNHLT